MTTSEQIPDLTNRPQLSGATIDAGLFDLLSRAGAADEFCRAWINLQCAMIGGTIAGLLLLDDGDGHFSSAAAWPDNRRDLTYLVETAQHALMQRKSFVSQPAAIGTAPDTIYIGQPIEAAGRLKGVVVIDVQRLPKEIPTIITELRWGIAWLETLFGRQQIEHDATKLARTNFAIKILSEFNDYSSFGAANVAIANELAARLSCCRVSIGILKKDSIRLAVMSHSAVFSEKSQIVSAIENAMEETADQRASVAVPATTKTHRRLVIAHESLAKQGGASAIASVPISNAAECIGVILLERDRKDAFDDVEIELVEAVAALIGPGLAAKLENNKLISGRAVQRVKSTFQALFGSGKPTLKIATVAFVLCLGYLAFAKGDFRIAAKAVVEGAVQRAVVAPYDGYIATAPVRAGDVVERGQILATLDDRELNLEVARWKGEHEQQSLKYGDAIAKHDRSAALVASAALDETQAQLGLLEDKLARSTIISPFRGAVVSGDLRQMQGSPVEKGKILFEIAPLESFRVILQVDERDIAFLADGQPGTLVLTGLSNGAIPFNVKTITPVATAAEGRNHFRVEADIHGDSFQIRPGMEGIGKISIDRRSLIAIWTRSLIDWIRITTWKWLP